MKAFFLGLGLAPLMMAGAAMADMPKYDPESHCNEVASFGGSYSASMYNMCLQEEQAQYNNLKAQWNSLPASVRDHCDQVASFGGDSSYSMLKMCVDQEMASASSKPAFKF